MSPDEHTLGRVLVSDGVVKTLVIVAEAVDGEHPIVRVDHLDASGRRVHCNRLGASEAETLAASITAGAHWLRWTMRGAPR